MIARFGPRQLRYGSEGDKRPRPAPARRKGEPPAEPPPVGPAPPPPDDAEPPPGTRVS